MPKKKTKKLAEEKKVYKIPDLNRIVPVVNGVQGRLGWKVPYDDNTTSFHMPEGGYDNDTRERFYKLLKDRFNLNLEADPKDAARRIFVTNSGGKSMMQDYLKHMEEIDLMPDCKEKFQLRAREAHELEKGLFFSMAKGSLAIVPLGEYEPRQVLCDYDKNVLVVTEPFSQSDPHSLRMKYHGYKVVDVPDLPERPLEPVFDKREPQMPEPPAPFNMPEPGPRPEPPRFKSAPQPPAEPADLLEGKSRQQRVKETYERLYAESGLQAPPSAPPSRPEPFTMMEPVAPAELSEEALNEKYKKPEKPANYDTVMQRYNEMGEEAEKLDPGRYDYENHIRVNLVKPEPFTVEEPVKPELDPPDYPQLGTTLELPGKPQPAYSFYKPEEPKYRESEIPHPVLGMEKPELPQLGALPEDLKEPEIRPEPHNPGGFARFFRFFSKNIRNQIKDHDNWLREKKELEDQYMAKKGSWIVKLKQDHARALEEYDRKMVLYDAAEAKYNEEMIKYNADVAVEAADLQIENDQIRMEYEYKLGEYNKSKELLGDRFDIERQNYENSVKEWEEKNPEIIKKNKEIRENNQKLLDEYEKACEPFKKIYGEAWGNEAGMKEIKNRITEKYDAELKDYNDARLRHEAAQARYDQELERVAKQCAEKGIDPEENRRYNEEYDNRAALAEKKEIERSDYLLSFPEVANYNNAQEVYEEDMDYYGENDPQEGYQNEKAEYEQKLEAYNKAKAEYDQKLNLYENYGKIAADYNNRNELLKRNAETIEDRKEQDNSNLKADYEKQKLQYEQDFNLWQRDKERYDDGVRAMNREGGLIYNWEKKVEDYNAAKKAHEEAVAQYNRDAADYPRKLDNYITEYKGYVKDLEIYKGKMEHYQQQVRERDAFVQANNKSANTYMDNIHKNPLYKDYTFRSHQYDFGHEKWDQKISRSAQYNKLQLTDMDKYRKQELENFKNYEHAKKHAPEKVSAKEQREYNIRVQEYNYINKYPQGMHNYLKTLNSQERAYNDELNKNFNKDSDITLNDYKKAAVEKMYYSVVRERAEKFGRTEYFSDSNTKSIDGLLDPAHADKAKAAMLGNKGLMKTLEAEYKTAKNDSCVAKSLQNRERMCKLYERAYEPENTKTAVKDPVLGEYRGSHDAVEKAMAKDPMGRK